MLAALLGTVKLPARLHLSYDLNRSLLVAKNYAERQGDINKPFLTCTFDRGKDSARSLDFCNFFGGQGLFYS
jgi:hypothetical protein